MNKKIGGGMMSIGGGIKKKSNLLSKPNLARTANFLGRTTYIV